MYTQMLLPEFYTRRNSCLSSYEHTSRRPKRASKERERRNKKGNGREVGWKGEKTLHGLWPAFSKARSRERAVPYAPVRRIKASAIPEWVIRHTTFHRRASERALLLPLLPFDYKYTRGASAFTEVCRQQPSVQKHPHHHRWAALVFSTISLRPINRLCLARPAVPPVATERMQTAAPAEALHKRVPSAQHWRAC